METPTQKAARHLLAARRGTQRLAREEDAALAQIEAMGLQARREDLTVWEMEIGQAEPQGIVLASAIYYNIDGYT